jgi:hypothetical protein
LLHTGVVGEAPGGGAGPVPPRHAFCDLFHTAFFVNTLTVMVPRRVLDDVGPFDERREVHIEDWDLWLRIAARYPFGYLPEPLAWHRPGGVMSRQIERTYEAQALVIEKNQALCAAACAEHRASPARCDRRRRHVLHRDWGYDRLVAGDRLGAREQLGRAVAYAPRNLRTRLLYLSTFLDPRTREAARRAAGLLRRRATGPVPAPVATPKRRPWTELSLVDDTLYRRARRRAASLVHGLDDELARTIGSTRRVLFEAASPMSFALFRPVYERLRRDPRVEIWFTAGTDAWAPDVIFGHAGITDRIVPRAAARWMKVAAYVNTDFWDMTWLRRRTRRIHLFHGVAGKYGLDAPTDLAPVISTFDCLMFANADRRRRYVEAGLVGDDPVQAALVGYPKVDCLVDGSLDRSAVLRRLGLDPAVPTVIYAPTWSPYSSLHAAGEGVIDGLAAEGLQVLVKLHDRSYDRARRGSGGIDWSARLARYDRHPGIRVIRDADSGPCLAAADAMVSDHSSIAFEYMLLDRPIVTIDCPALVEQAAISADKLQRMRAATRLAHDASDAVAAVIDELEHPEARSAARRRTAAELFHEPGTATDRAIALIYELIELPLAVDLATPVPSRAVAAAG